MRNFWRCVLLFACCAALPAVARAELVNFYVGVDGRPTLTSGVYAGLPNPNAGRLTFLAYPGDHDQPMGAHFHGIGAFSYVGTPPDQVVQGTNTNNHIPEIHTAQPPLSMLPGSGLYEGAWVSGPASGEHYSDLTMRSVADLSGFDAPSIEHYLFNSSNGGWNGSLGAAHVALELVSVSAGLHIGDQVTKEILATPGDRHGIGVGDEIDFEPVFWTENPGVYSAEFRLVDLNDATAIPTSGTFHFDFVAVPEPGALALLAVSSLLLYPFLPRKRRE